MISNLEPLPWRVIITRPLQSALAWCETLGQAGFATETLPLLEIVPVSDEARMRAIQTLILDYDHYDAVFFVSMNAVREAMDWLDRFWPQLPVGIRYYAVGASTAALLKTYGINVEEPHLIEDGAMTSEALLQAASLQQLEHQRFIIFRGVGGRHLMADTLAARGALVSVCELYERRMPMASQPTWERLLSDEHNWNSHYNVIALHSGESLANWHTLIRSMACNTPLCESAKDTVLLVPSQRLANEAAERGFSRVLVAQNATDIAMTDALCRARGY